MPKSGFDPQCHQRKLHQRKLHRHNPLSKSASSSVQGSPSSAVSSASLDALQQAAKLTNGGSSASAKSSASTDIVPLLANLPTPDAPSSTSADVSLADKVWALASVSLLLTVSPTQTPAQVKSHRKILLSHNLVGRLLLALQSHAEVDVRREASGALRNLCVDSGIDVRNQVVNNGGIATILSAMRWASHALGFDAAAAASSSAANPSISFVDDAPTAEQDLESKRALLAKPLDKMNKKQKRHATKLATALGKTLEHVAGQGLSADDQQKLVSHAGSDTNHSSDTSGATAQRGEPFLSLDANTRKGLIEMAENLVTVVWCLCESGDKPFAKLVGWKWLDGDIVGAGADHELSGEALASWLSSAISLGSRAASVLSTAAADGSRPSSSLNHDATDTLSILSNKELSLLLDLALASGNALCALTDGGEADLVDGLLSRKPTPPPPSKPSKKKGAKPDVSANVSVAPPPRSLSEQPASATSRLSAIQTALTLLEACVQTDHTTIDKLKRYILSQTTMLGVLAAGVLRNIIATVDANCASSAGRSAKSARKHTSVNALTSSNIFMKLDDASDEQGVSLRRYEESRILPTLTRLVAGVNMTKLAHDLDGRADVSEEAVSLAGAGGAAGEVQDEAALRAKMQGKAEEKAQTLMLALEVLAEMVGGLDTRAGGAGEDNDDGDEEWLEDLDADDDEGEGEGEGEDEEDEMEGLSSTNDDGVVSSSRPTDTFADAVKRSGSMLFEGYAPVLCRMLTDVPLMPSLLTLARPFEASFPSLTSTSASTSASDKPTSNLLRALHLRSLSVLNNLLMRLAHFSPPPPSQPATDPKDQRRIAAFRSWTAGEPQKQALKTVWTSVYEIAKGCASVPAVASASPAAKEEREREDGLSLVETCIGTIWSIARVFEGNLPLSTTTTTAPTSSSAGSEDPNSAEYEIIHALISGYTLAHTDGMRVKCILTLSTLALSPTLPVKINALIGDFFVGQLEAIPDQTPTPSTTGGPTAEAMVALINGLIDVYADESASWDQLAFREQNLLRRIRLTLFSCKALARSIDKRKHFSLRATAQEAVQNLHDFVQYRQSLGF